ncbi:WecB/TagA/CpsF family glycosyltransferase [Desulfitobacterium sp.]|uniref:WecB/TagA/CpsF family glycosyltransferase n=1 Tax=Desulfitobacterium sp. TaxID=49981 RepID=UPI002B1F5022|nr:WecB/TagA/CpsF family glycosyltransferase [Desulfitobacterium sp.]MEA4902704.1 WecB/TagA/CpsF family glycosyltransferase [Desulfitobacterium sp.]
MRTEVLGVKIDNYTIQETVMRIREAVEKKEQTWVVTANPELIFAAGRDARLKQLINRAQIVTPDGVGVVWAAKRLGHPLPERVTGIDLIESLFPVAAERKWRIFFLGSKPGVAELAARKVTEQYPGIVCQTQHGYFQPEEQPEIIERIQTFQPQLLLAGLGAPRQEFWIASHLDLATVSIGVGGSFDALAGLNKRAPQWIRNIRLEWLYRLLKQPQRIKRQMVLPKFAWRVIKQGKKEEQNHTRRSR